MANGSLGIALGTLLKLQRLAAHLASESSPRIAARDAGFRMLVVDVVQVLRGVPSDTPGLGAAQMLWVALERCADRLIIHDTSFPRDVLQLAEVVEEARAIAETITSSS